MRRLSLNLKILAGFAIAIAGIGYFLFITYQIAQRSAHENFEANNHLEIISASEQILDDMQDIETGYRGYLITLDTNYLKPCQVAMDRTGQDIDQLVKVTRSDRAKSTSVNSLVELVNQKTAFADTIVRLCREINTTEASKMLRDGEGRRMMDNIRTLVARLENESRNALNASATEREKNANETRNNFLVLSVLILMLMIIFYLFIITDLKRSEKDRIELFDAGDKIQDLYEHAPSGYISLDILLNITKANQTALKLLGYSEQELFKLKNLAVLVNPGSVSMLSKLIENETVSNLEIELEGKHRTIPVILDTVTRRDMLGNIAEKRIILTDISERKKAEEQNRYLAKLIDQTSDAIYSTDKSFLIKSWNKGAEKMYGFTAEEVLNKDSSILRSSLSPVERQNLVAELAEKGFWSGELVHQKMDGTTINIYSSITTLKDEEDKITGYVSVIQDITARKTYEEKLRNFNNVLLEKVNVKTQEIVNILERVTDGFISIDKDYVVTHVNNIAASMFGMEKSQILGKNLTTLWDKQDNIFRRTYKKAFETQTRMEVEDYYPYFGKWYYCVMHPSPEGISSFVRDVTKRKESEIKLVESEKQYRHLFENNPLPMWVLDLETNTIIDLNNATIDQYGYSRIEFIGKNMLDLMPEHERLRYKEFDIVRMEGEEYAGIWQHITSDKKIIKVEILSYDTLYTERPSRLIIANDITEKLKYEEELRASRDELRQLSEHQEKVREEERAYIAREIHDELGQQLTGLKMDLSWISKRVNDDSSALKEKITSMLGLIDETVKSVRKISSQLRPGMLDDLGLTAALDWQTNEFKKRSGINCYFHSEVSETILDKNISIGVFRIMQEALTNVARHSNATEVNCFLTSNNSHLKLFISDNGTGIPKAGPKRKTLGLLGMQERALMMNGILSIDSMPGEGTKISLVVPLVHNQN